MNTPSVGQHDLLLARLRHELQAAQKERDDATWQRDTWRKAAERLLQQTHDLAAARDAWMERALAAPKHTVDDTSGINPVPRALAPFPQSSPPFPLRALRVGGWINTLKKYRRISGGGRRRSA